MPIQRLTAEPVYPPHHLVLFDVVHVDEHGHRRQYVHPASSAAVAQDLALRHFGLARYLSVKPQGTSS